MRLTFSFGKRSSTPDRIITPRAVWAPSPLERIAAIISWSCTGGAGVALAGALGLGRPADEPPCMLTTMPVSCTMAQNGSSPATGSGLPLGEPEYWKWTKPFFTTRSSSCMASSTPRLGRWAAGSMRLGSPSWAQSQMPSL